MNLEQAELFRRQMHKLGVPSDGCTWAPEVGTPCCQMHDYLRRFLPDGMTPLQADNLLCACIWKKGSWRKPWYWPLSPVYWLGAVIPRLLGFYK